MVAAAGETAEAAAAGAAAGAQLPAAVNQEEEEAEDEEEEDAYFRTEDLFLTGLDELLRAYQEYTSATGPAASRPRLQACVTVMDKLAWSLEAVSAWVVFGCVALRWWIGSIEL